VAPTTPTDSRTQTSPYGNPEPPIDACKLAIASGATYVARWTTAQPAALVKAMKEAIRHKGFSFIDTISQCPTQAGRYIFANDDPATLLEMLKTRKISRAQAEKLPIEELQDRIVTGRLFEDNKKQEFVAKMYSLMETAKG
jgi:2-oxoglutarate ferredoxin oxidoreductase subunit beta